MKATKVGDAVTVETSNNGFALGVIPKTTMTQTTVKTAGGEYRFVGVVGTTGADKLNEVGRHGRAVLWLDSERAETERVRRIEAAAAREAEKAKAKADKLAASAKYVQDLVDFARMLETFQPVDESDAAQIDARVRRNIGHAWMSAHETLIERSARLLEYPGSYFEWAAEDMKAAAKREFLDDLLHGMMKGEHTLAAMVKHLHERTTERIINDEYRGSSSSAAHNAMQDARREVACSFVRWDLCHWVDAFKEVAKTATTPEANPFCAPMTA